MQGQGAGARRRWVQTDSGQDVEEMNARITTAAFATQFRF